MNQKPLKLVSGFFVACAGCALALWLAWARVALEQRPVSPPIRPDDSFGIRGITLQFCYQLGDIK
jgi:hypothetical protein